MSEISSQSQIQGSEGASWLFFLLEGHQMDPATTLFLQLFQESGSLTEATSPFRDPQGSKNNPSHIQPISPKAIKKFVHMHTWVRQTLLHLHQEFSARAFLAKAPVQENLTTKAPETPKLSQEISASLEKESSFLIPKEKKMVFFPLQRKIPVKTGDHPAFVRSTPLQESPPNTSGRLTLDIPFMKAFQDFSHAKLRPQLLLSQPNTIDPVDFFTKVLQIAKISLPIKEMLQDTKFLTTCVQKLFVEILEKPEPQEKMLFPKDSMEKTVASLLSIPPKVVAKALVKILATVFTEPSSLKILAQEEVRMTQPLPFSPKMTLQPRKERIKKKSSDQEEHIHDDQECMEEE